MTTHRGVFVEKRTRQKDGSITPASGIGALYLPHGRYDMTVAGPDGFTGSVEWDGGVPVIVSDEPQIVVILADVERGGETILTGTVAEVNDGLRQIDFSAELTVLSMDFARGTNMARDFVKVDKAQAGQKFGPDLMTAATQTRFLIDHLEFIKGVMEHNTDGSNYADVETLFGLAAGNGAIAYNLIAGTLGALKGTAQSSDALTLIDRVG